MREFLLVFSMNEPYLDSGLTKLTNHFRLWLWTPIA